MITFQNVTFTYPGASRPALQDVSLHIPGSALCLVAGASGSGKSTLLRCINGLAPHFSGGRMAGSITVDGLDPVRLSPQGMSRHVGFVFQDPEAQFVVDQVEDEIAFALENQAMPPPEMAQRVGEALDLLELRPLRRRRLETLSGGERQRVAIAAALALRPQVLVLDEPTSQLDPHTAEEVLQALLRLNNSLGLTVVLAEHRLERVLPFASQMLYLSASQPGLVSGLPRDVLAQVALNPPLVALGKAMGWRPLPLTVEEARAHLKAVELHPPEEFLPPATVQPNTTTQPFIQAEGLGVSYGDFYALRDASLSLFPGQIAALLGPNGAGKTTLLRCLVGLLRPQQGRVLVAGQDIAGQDTADICRRVGYLPQDPNALLFADSVLDELLATLRNFSSPAGRRKKPEAALSTAAVTADPKAVALTLLERLGLSSLAAAYPRDLSAGERQRAALGAVTVTHPAALLLDEPTRGLDYAAKRTLASLLQGWRDEGMAILLVTHDVELAAAAADRAILMEAGTITADGPAFEVLSRSKHFVPQVAQVFSEIYPSLSPEDPGMEVKAHAFQE